jgi:adenosylcobinamide kinase/adenosylcobinamide-phosphate guanylyltransferase
LSIVHVFCFQPMWIPQGRSCVAPLAGRKGGDHKNAPLLMPQRTIRPVTGLPLEHDVSSSIPPLTLVLGGARSGKSRYAESLITAQPPPWIYVATAEAGDAEMAERVALHRARRGDGWQTIEAPHDLAGVLAQTGGHAPALVDCLTLWLSNRMLAEADVEAEAADLEAAIASRRGPAVLVSNEVGFGIVPDNALARRFRDLQGRLNQRMAACAGRVILMVAGLPLVVKDAT